MEFWFNNFVEFEMKRNRENRLILNFSYANGNEPSGEELLPQSNIKVYVPIKIKVPTWFLTPEMSERIIKKFRENESLGAFGLERKIRSGFEVLEAEIPNIPSLLDELERMNFQTGSYTKLLRYGGFYPERTAILEERLISDASQTGEIELPNLDSIHFGNFLTLEEAKKLPYVILDIEKPLWKKEREKELISLRERLLLAKEDERTEQRKRIIGKIEERLLWRDSEIEPSGFYEERFNADVSYVGAIWVDGKERIKELYVVDARNEIDKQQHNGFKILKFKSESELLLALRDAFKRRKPLVAIGHNEVYDYSQIRFAADESKIIFDPAVKDVRPRRDFVREFLQRQKEDLIYLDTLWFGRIRYPYLNQKRFDTSFKLAELARHLGIDFTKSLTHEQLREVEMKRLAGKTPEIRKKAANEMVEYTCGDLWVTEELFHRLNPWPFLIAMKNALPFCTYTEIAFSPNIMNKLHEHRHFIDSGNLPYTGFKRRQRQEEIEIFKKKFPALKQKHLKKVSLKRAHRGLYSDVSEYYVSLESWFLDYAFSLNPELREASESLQGESEFAFLQYIRAYMIQIFSDYFQANIQKDKISEDPNYTDYEKLELKEAVERRFYARYRFDTEKVRKHVREGYKGLAESIRENRMIYLDHIGDYIFVQGEGEITGARKIRTLESFEVQ